MTVFDEQFKSQRFAEYKQRLEASANGVPDFSQLGTLLANSGEPEISGVRPMLFAKRQENGIYHAWTGEAIYEHGKLINVTVKDFPYTYTPPSYSRSTYAPIPGVPPRFHYPQLYTGDLSHSVEIQHFPGHRGLPSPDSIRRQHLLHSLWAVSEKYEEGLLVGVHDLGDLSMDFDQYKDLRFEPPNIEFKYGGPLPLSVKKPGMRMGRK